MVRSGLSADCQEGFVVGVPSISRAGVLHETPRLETLMDLQTAIPPRSLNPACHFLGVCFVDGVRVKYGIHRPILTVSFGLFLVGGNTQTTLGRGSYSLPIILATGASIRLPLGATTDDTQVSRGNNFP